MVGSFLHYLQISGTDGSVGVGENSGHPGVESGLGFRAAQISSHGVQLSYPLGQTRL